jgi:VIT1/CCC1 family predicted Fe2+/Mn2+ transporter
MKSHRDEIDLSAELRGLRPTPRPEFTSALDSRADAGFPSAGRIQSSGSGRLPQLFQALGRIPSRLSSVPRRRLIVPASTAAVAAIATATAVVVISEDRTATTTATRIGSPRAAPDTAPGTVESSGAHLAAPAQRSGSHGNGRLEPFSRRAAPAGDSSGVQFSGHPPTVTPQRSSSGTAAGGAAVSPGALRAVERLAGPGPYAARATHRDVERSAEIVLVAAPSDVRGDAAKVFETVHAYHGIVLRSSIRDGRAGEAGANFDLLVPSGRLGDAMAAFSDIAGVRSRHESTMDVTAQTIGLGERLQDAQARVESLLAEVSGAGSEAEREAAEAKLRSARRRAAALRARLASLRRQTHLSSVSLRIETGGPTGDGNGWGVGEALGDAGHILSVAAGVGLVGLAILVPPFLIGLLAWLAHRGWVRRRRERALD